MADPETYDDRTKAALLDALKGVGPGLAKGAMGLMTLPSSVYDMYSKGVGYGIDKLGHMIDPNAPPITESTQQLLNNVKSQNPGANIGPTDYQSVLDKVEGATGKIPEPETKFGKVVQAGVENLPQLAFTPGNIGLNFARAMSSGAAGELANQATQGMVPGPYAKMAGAVAGDIAPFLLSHGAGAKPVRELNNSSAFNAIPIGDDTIPVSGNGEGFDPRLVVKALASGHQPTATY